VTGPVMAKGIEDTAFYVYNRLVSLNEVGGHPEKFGCPVDTFHRQNSERAAAWPNSMLTTSTHDTKRGEDVRARINVLSEFAEEWECQVTEWRKLLAESVSMVDCAPAPSPNDQYAFFQCLVGSWPDPPMSSAADLAAYRDRLLAYMQKATKEAKQNTSWVNPNEEYDEAVRRYVSAALAEPLNGNPFLAAFGPFAGRVAFFGRLNALAQVLLKLTCPGVPDIYQVVPHGEDPPRPKPPVRGLRKQDIRPGRSKGLASGGRLCVPPRRRPGKGSNGRLHASHQGFRTPGHPPHRRDMLDRHVPCISRQIARAGLAGRINRPAGLPFTIRGSGGPMGERCVRRPAGCSAGADP
jgi:hypothetical protein